MRKILYKYVPKDLIERPKAGFSVPLDKWLRSSLRDWGGDLISKEIIEKHGILNYEPINKLWLDHLFGKKVIIVVNCGPL